MITPEQDTIIRESAHLRETMGTPGWQILIRVINAMSEDSARAMLRPETGPEEYLRLKTRYIAIQDVLKLLEYKKNEGLKLVRNLSVVN